ncbi:DDK kinase regulatory subunit [Spathaspora sp. JA1]|nr:DDK kinase regulatory subunit [Spathaspora sp. JA1]
MNHDNTNQTTALPGRNLKKHFNSLLTKPRRPLRETSSNIPSPTHKRIKLDLSQQHSNQPHSSTNEPVQLKEKPEPTIQKEEKEVEFISTSSVLQPQPKLQPQQQKHQSHEHRNSHNTQQQQAKGVGRLAGEELYNWQQSWRKIMHESTVYFEDVQELGRMHTSEYRRASRLLKLVGCEITPFYDNSVTIIVSRRHFDAKKTYPSNDIFSNVTSLKIKVWNYEKVFRFLKNLGVNIATGVDENALNTHTILPPSLTTDSAGKTNRDNLYNLLKEEKIYGSTDRDPNAKRDDLHYLGKNYLFVYDLLQKVRPIAVREWNDDSSYTTLNLTMDGKCPFIFDPSDSSNTERKRLRRARKFEANQEYRESLKQATYNIINNIKNGGVSLHVSGFSGTSTSTDKATRDEEYLEQQEDNTTVIQNCSSTSGRKSGDNGSGEWASEQTVKPLKFRQPIPPALARNSSCIQSTTTKTFDVFAASGYNSASNALQFSMDSNLNSNAAAMIGNGLGPTVSQVPSRNLNNLKRRIIMKKQQRKTTPPKSKDARELNPGYCENCRAKYDCFDDHIKSNRHRNFACDDSNFRDIDELIARLNESRSFGYVTSNGDYF